MNAITGNLTRTHHFSRTRRWGFALFALTALIALMTLGLAGCDRTAEEASSAYAKGDYKRAFAAYSKLAQAGDANAQFTLGLMYFEGTGVEKDLAEAARWYRRAANQGQVMAQNNLGAMLMEGKGVPQDHAEAAFWFTLVADKGDPHGKHLRDSLAAHLKPEQQDAARQKAKDWKPQAESRGWF